MKTKLLLIVLLVFSTNILQSQDNLVFGKVKIRQNKIILSINNKSPEKFVIYDFACTFKNNFYTPIYYSFLNDTLEIVLFNFEQDFQTGHRSNDVVIIDGKRIKNDFEIQPNQKVKFLVPEKRIKKVKFIKLHLSKSDILFCDSNISVHFFGRFKHSK